MLPFGVTIPATVTQGSDIPEGLMNNPVLISWNRQLLGCLLCCIDMCPLSEVKNSYDAGPKCLPAATVFTCKQPYSHVTVVTCFNRMDLTLYSPVVTMCTTSLTFNNSAICPHSVFMCFVWIWEKNSDYSPIKH